MTAFSNSDTGTQGYVVQAGNTLEGIAQAVSRPLSGWVGLLFFLIRFFFSLAALTLRNGVFGVRNPA